ncbi:MAG: hypothetical protein AAF959_07230 [Cyanobacteria bacterium P01_D01_bin.56]
MRDTEERPWKMIAIFVYLGWVKSRVCGVQPKVLISVALWVSFQQCDKDAPSVWSMFSMYSYGLTEKLGMLGAFSESLHLKNLGFLGSMPNPSN